MYYSGIQDVKRIFAAFVRRLRRWWQLLRHHAIASQLPVIARVRSNRSNPLSAGLLRFARNDEAG
ncbi:MAG: hypothetical protein LBS91_09325, partial [Clostridiales Family XIII bacterium]|nr:hypothetical protein [Clostridiales Family XIII bacterium]